MIDSRPLIILIVLASLVLGTGSVKEHHRAARQHSDHSDSESQEDCTTMPWAFPWLPPCSTTQSTPVSTSVTTSSSTSTGTTDSSSTLTSTSASVLENALWCQLRNGTYLPRNYTYFQSSCSVCRCTDAKVIRCTFLQCLPAYCVDDSMPNRKEGQCCAQCSYEDPGRSCLYEGINYPHGTIVKYSEPNTQCWCQMGGIECRSDIASLLQGFQMLTDGAVLYIILFVLFCVFIFGSMICCSCTFIIFYYYQRHQASFQQVYDEYTNAGGWQPIEEEEEYAVDGSAEEKYLEAEKSATVGEGTRENVPPPYSTVNNS